MANTLQQLLEHGQSPWIDNITRGMLTGGELQRLIDLGIVGLTSNPTIFQKAIGSGTDYDEALQQLVREGKDIDAIYDALVLDDIRNAARILRPVYDRMNGNDGFVSIEVSPELAHDTEKTVADARRFFSFLNQPNIMIKVPGTAEGVPAFRTLIGEGINVNVTLLFAIENYRAIAEAYIKGLETLAGSGKPLDRVASVASFFVSRVDTAVDALLEEKIKNDPARADQYRALLGKAAIANAKLAYADVYEQVFSGPRWDALAAKGAHKQRPLWASTSTKNPAYRDVLYVEELIGPDTVDTMPPATITDFLDHGRVRDSLTEDVEGAREVMRRLAAAGIDMDAVTRKLQDDGVASFAKSFHDLIETISQKRQQMLAHAG
ncbi:MAG TPA: transaldolase [Chloroflexota bacterium]|jgi:transaldolase|nr:transaldolase [Chloroflexota bacterium]